MNKDAVTAVIAICLSILMLAVILGVSSHYDGLTRLELMKECIKSQKYECKIR